MKQLFLALFAILLNFTALCQDFSSSSYENTFAGTSYNGNGQNWNLSGVWGTNSIVYSQNNKLDISFTQSSWIYAENKFDNTIDISSNKVLEFEASFSTPNRYLLVYLFDASGATSGPFSQAIFSLSTTTSTFSVDFSAIPATNIDFSKIKGVRFYIVDTESGNPNATLSNETLTLSRLKIGDGADGNNNLDLIRWTGDQQNINIYNTNSGNVSLGTNSASEPTLSTPYYKFTIDGRTNIIGTSNALNIWHPSTQSNGFRHYMVFGNETFSNGLDYGVIGVNEYNRSTEVANPKHLLLQTNSQNGGANVGIGYFSKSPAAKLTIQSGSNSNSLAVVDSDEKKVFLVTNEGVAYATELQVRLKKDFPDYVFKSNYKLMSLDSLGEFIAKENHLPNVPSGKELKGVIGLGELTRVQQEKIEELTLYILELKKRIDALELKQN